MRYCLVRDGFNARDAGGNIETSPQISVVITQPGEHASVPSNLIESNGTRQLIPRPLFVLPLALRSADGP